MNGSKKLGLWSIGFWVALVVWSISGPISTGGRTPAPGFWIGFGVLSYICLQLLLISKVVEYQEKKR